MNRFSTKTVIGNILTYLHAAIICCCTSSCGGIVLCRPLAIVQVAIIESSMVNEWGGIVMNGKFIYRSVVCWSGVNSLQYSRLILRHYIVTEWIYKYKHPWSLKGFPFPMPNFCILSCYVKCSVNRLQSTDCSVVWPCKRLWCYNIHRFVGGEHRVVDVEPWWQYIVGFELNTYLALNVWIVTATCFGYQLIE